MNLKPISRCAFVSRPFECRWTESDTMLRARLQQPRRFGSKKSALRPDLVHRPRHGVVAVAGAGRLSLGVSTDLRAPDHVVEDVAAADRRAPVAAGRRRR